MFLSKYENVHVFQSVQCKKGNWKYQKLCKYSHVKEAKEKRQPYESSQCTLYNLLLNYQCSRISVLENCNIHERKCTIWVLFKKCAYSIFTNGCKASWYSKIIFQKNLNPKSGKWKKTSWHVSKKDVRPNNQTWLSSRLRKRRADAAL